MLQGETVGGQILTGLDKCEIITFRAAETGEVKKAKESLQKIIQTSSAYSLLVNSSGTGYNQWAMTTIVICYAEKGKE